MIKYLFLLITASSLFLFSACNGDKPSTPDTPDSPDGEDFIMTMMPVDESVKLTRPENPSPDAMSPYIGLWAFTKSFTSSPERMDDYKGRWIKFNEDGTFIYGKWEKETNKGEWWVGEGTPQVAMDFADDEANIDLDWKVNLGGDVIILLGNTERNKTGDQIRVQRVDELPVKPTE